MVLYIIRIFNNEESFIKIGITKKTVFQRCSELRRIGYNIEIIHELEMNMFDAFNTEQSLLMEVDNFSYIPHYKFNGMSECIIDSDITIDIINKLLENINAYQN